jgi:hypothetical protein
VLFTPDGKTLIAAGGSFDPRIFVYDTATAKERRQLKGHTDYIEAIALSPNGKTLASAAWDKTVRLWDLDTGKEQQSWAGSESYHARMGFTADGTGLFATDGTGAVYLRDLSTGKPRRSFPSLAHLMATSPGGHTLAGTTHDNAVALVEATTDQERRRISSGSSTPSWMVFSPDGRRLLTDARDGTALLWDVTSSANVGLATREHEPVWRALGAEAGPAYDAIWKLVLSPKESVPLLREKLRPAAPVDGTLISRRVAELDDDDFQVREKAMQDLETVGEAARTALEKALAGSPSAELRRRAEALLTKLDQGGLGAEAMRELRALEVLEEIGTPEARKVLEGLAKGPADARLTREVKALLRRWPTR